MVEEEESSVKHKVVTLGARRMTRRAGHMGAECKARKWRAYRRRVRMIDHTSEDANYDPTSATRLTDWSVA